MTPPSSCIRATSSLACWAGMVDGAPRAVGGAGTDVDEDESAVCQWSLICPTPAMTEPWLSAWGGRTGRVSFASLTTRTRSSTHLLCGSALLKLYDMVESGAGRGEGDDWAEALYDGVSEVERPEGALGSWSRTSKYARRGATLSAAGMLLSKSLVVRLSRRKARVKVPRPPRE